VSDLKGTVQFHPAEITLSDIDGNVAEGRVTGEVAFRRDKDGLTMHARGELAGARAAALFPALSKNAIDGPLTIRLQSDSVGQSPLGFIGFLRGSGAIALTDAQIAGLDGAAFDAAVRTADQSGTIEAPKILAAVNAAMANGRITVPHGDTAFVINAGRLALQKSTLQTAGGTTLSLGGTLDLATAALDGRVTLQAKPAVNALIALPPELSVTFQGPLGTPARAVDVTALVGWLTLRAAELQTRRIESIEANHRPEAAGPLVRLDSPTIRIAPAGTVVESEAPADVPPPGSRGFDRLQAEPTAAPAAVSPPPVRPASPRPTGKSTSSAETTDQIRLPPAPQTAAPAARSGFDFLFRPQN
jgi:AsmA-like C-terminal region